MSRSRATISGTISSDLSSSQKWTVAASKRPSGSHDFGERERRQVLSLRAHGVGLNDLIEGSRPAGHEIVGTSRDLFEFCFDSVRDPPPIADGEIGRLVDHEQGSRLVFLGLVEIS